MAAPEGYRLLTVADVGKVFGEDLETKIYIDTSVNLQGSSIFVKDEVVELTNFILTSYLYSDGYGVYMPRIDADDIVSNGVICVPLWEGSVHWLVAEHGDTHVTNGLELTDFNTDINWNTWLYVKDRDIYDQTVKGTKFTIKCAGQKMVNDLKINVDVEVLNAQERTVTPTKSTQYIYPLYEYNALSKVTVHPIPNTYITPTGTKDIDSNGEHDVTTYAKVNVQVPIPTIEQWAGAYEEISSGYTVTLQLGTYLSRNPFTSNTGYTYSIDGGVTKIPLYNQSVPIVLNNVQTIGFYGTSALSLHLGSTLDGSEYGYVHGGNGVVENIIYIDKNTTIYVSASETGSGGGND